MKYETKKLQQLLPTITRLLEYEKYTHKSINTIHSNILNNNLYFNAIALGVIILFVSIAIAKIKNLDASSIQNTYLSFILLIFISIMINIVRSKIYDRKRKTIISYFNQQKQNNIKVELNYDDYYFANTTKTWGDIKQLYSKYVNHDDIMALTLLIDIDEMINVQLNSKSYTFTSIKPILALVDESFKFIQNNIRTSVFKGQED